MERIIACKIALFVFLMLMLCVLPLLYPQADDSAGLLCIGDICAEVYTAHGATCDCCAPLWGGGIAVTDADLSSVQEGDWATITLLDGTRLAMECAAITPCIQVSSWIVTRYGILRPGGDILVLEKTPSIIRRVFLFTIL